MILRTMGSCHITLRVKPAVVLQGRCKLENQDGGPGQLQPLVRPSMKSDLQLCIGLVSSRTTMNLPTWRVSDA